MPKGLILLAVTALCSLASAQTAVAPILQPHQAFVNSSGSPCAGCSLYSYAAGTTTPLATYTDSSGTSQNTNPIILDTAGSAQIWLGNHSYKFVLEDATGTTLWTVDNVSSLTGLGGNYLPLSGGTLTGGLTAPSVTITGNFSAASLTSPNFNNIIYADGYTTSGTWMGAWSSTTAYPACAAVSYSGATYVAGAANANAEPDTSFSYWLQVSTTGASTTPTPLDCAMAAAEVLTAGQNTNVSMYLGNNISGYNTCTGLTLSNPLSYTGSAVNLIGAAYSGSSIRQTCSISQPTIYLPVETGSYAAGKAKQLDVERLYVDAQQNATYAVGILGSNKNSTFFNIHARNGTTGDFVFGVNGNNDGWNYQEKFYQLFAEYSWSPSGSGAAGTVTLSGGVPSVSITAGGLNYTSHVRAYLVGYQSGTSNQPCTNMGTTTPTISGGSITGVTTTATGCSGTVYVQFDDSPPIQYGTDMEFVTDSTFYSLEEVAGYLAGLRDVHGANSIYSHHAFTQGQYGSEIHSYDNIFGENCGEQSEGCWNLSTPAKISGANYYSSIQYNGYALIHQSALGNGMHATNISCSFTQSGEYHTFVSPSGTVDAGGSQLGNNTLTGVQYCGSGSGAQIFYNPSMSTETMSLGGISGSSQPDLYWCYGTTCYWQDYISAANGNRRIYDIVNSLLRFELAPNSYTNINSGNGNYTINFNSAPNAGTGGISVWSGGTSPAAVGGISGAGKITGTSVSLSGSPQISSGTSLNTDLNGVVTLSGGSATYTFTGTYTTAPVCTASDATSAAAVKVSVSTTVLTFTGTGTDNVNYICMGRN